MQAFYCFRTVENFVFGRTGTVLCVFPLSFNRTPMIVSSILLSKSLKLNDTIYILTYCLSAATTTFSASASTVATWSWNSSE